MEATKSGSKRRSAGEVGVIFEQLSDSACRTYLVACERSRQAALVDPVLEEVDGYLAALAKGGYTLRYAINTHSHADHLSATPTLADRTGAERVMHRNAPPLCLTRSVDQGDILELGDLAISVLYTPGHTVDSISLLAPGRVMTGDALFIGGAGRTDLPGGDPSQHYDTIFNCYASLPDDTLIYPAHEYGGHDTSLLGHEKETNPYFLPRSREQYVAWLRAQSQPTPEWMVQMLKANARLERDASKVWRPAEAPACMAGGTTPAVDTSKVQRLSPEMVRDMLSEAEDAPIVLDVREPEEYSGELGHIDGSRLVPVGSLLSRIEDVEPIRHRLIVTVCKSGGRSATAAAILEQHGFATVATMEGGMTAWNEKGYPVVR